MKIFGEADSEGIDLVFVFKRLEIIPADANQPLPIGDEHEQ